MKDQSQEFDYTQVEGSSTLLFSPEIETATVAIAWREPERVALLKRQLDPALHFIQPHCRWILSAIDIAWGELGLADWPNVIQILRELSRLEDAGGLDGVLDVWREGEFLSSSVWQQAGKTDKLFAHYIKMLKAYALARQKVPPLAYKHFVGGKGTLWLNKVRKNKSAPDFAGEARISGKLYQLKGWLSTNGQFLNVSFDEL